MMDVCAFLTIVPPVCRHTSSDRDLVSGASSLHSDGRDSNHLLPNHLWLQSTPAAAILRSFRMVLVHDVAAPAGCWNPSRSPPATDFRNTDTRRPCPPGTGLYSTRACGMQHIHPNCPSTTFYSCCLGAPNP